MKLMKTTIGIIIVTLISIFLGFARESIVVYKLGAGWQADSFIFSIMFPGLIFSSIGGVISTVFVPLYTDLRINESLEEANDFANNLINIIIIITLILVFIGEIYTPEIIKILAPGFKGETYEMTVKLVRMILPSMFFMGLMYCFVGILTSFKELIITAAISIPLHLSIILGLILIYPRLGLQWTIIAVILGSILQVIIFIPKLVQKKYKYKVKFNLKKAYIMQALNMIGPMSIGIMAQQINTLIDRALASTLDAGSITAINLASKVNLASYNSLVFIVSMLVFPMLAECSAQKDSEKFEEILRLGINIVIGLMLPITLITICFRQEIISVLFGYGKFSQKNIIDTSEILLFYSIGTCFLGLRDILNRAFYALQDTKVPMKNGIIAIIINVITSLLLIKILKARGLALGTSISMVVVSLMLLRNIKIKFKYMNFKNIYTNIFKISISGFIMYMSMLLIKNIYNLIKISMFTKIEMILLMGIISLVSIVIYISSLFILKVDGIEFIIKKLKNHNFLKKERIRN